MTKVTLVGVGNIVDATTAETNINNNSAAIVTAVENTLSRDGTSPNQMGAALDMNSNRIINLPAPISSTEPVRVLDLTGGSAVTVNNLPTGGTTRQVLAKNSNTSFDVTWNNSGVPNGGTANQILKKNTGTDYDASWVTPSSLPGGFVFGPGASTDNAAARFDTTTGVLLQNSALQIADTTGALTRTGGGGIPVQGMNTNAAAVAAGNVGEFTTNAVQAVSGVPITTGTAGQIWNTLTLGPGAWLLWASTGVLGTPLGGASTTVFQHMHCGMGLNMTSIPSAPNSGSTAMHVNSNNPNGWLITNNPYVVYLTAGSNTINAVATADFTGGTAVIYGTLSALRIA